MINAYYLSKQGTWGFKTCSLFYPYINPIIPILKRRKIDSKAIWKTRISPNSSVLFLPLLPEIINGLCVVGILFLPVLELL